MAGAARAKGAKERGGIGRVVGIRMVGSEKGHEVRADDRVGRKDSTMGWSGVGLWGLRRRGRTGRERRGLTKEKDRQGRGAEELHCWVGLVWGAVGGEGVEGKG